MKKEEQLDDVDKGVNDDGDDNDSDDKIKNNLYNG